MKQKYNSITSIDWLDIRFNAKKAFQLQGSNKLQIADNLFVEPFNESTKAFKSDAYLNHYILFLGDQRIGIIATNPIVGNYLPQHSCYVHLDNFVFYDLTFGDILHRLLYNDYLEFSNIIRLDIACNTTENIVNKFERFYSGWKAKDKKYSFFGNKNVPSEDPFENSTGEVILGYRIKKCKNEKFIKIYDKTAAWVETPQEYQEQFFKSNGLMANIYRCEFSLNSKSIRTLNLCIDVEYLSNQDYVNYIFNYLSQKFLKIRIIKTKNATRDTKINFLDPLPTDGRYVIKQPIAPIIEFNKNYKSVISFIVKKTVEYGNVSMLDFLRLLLKVDPHPSNLLWFKVQARKHGFNPKHTKNKIQ